MLSPPPTLASMLDTPSGSHVLSLRETAGSRLCKRPGRTDW